MRAHVTQTRAHRQPGEIIKRRCAWAERDETPEGAHAINNRLTMVQNKRRRKYWAIRSSVRSFPRTTSLLQTAQFTRAPHCTNTFIRSRICSLTPEPAGKQMFQNKAVTSVVNHSALRVRWRNSEFINPERCATSPLAVHTA